MGERLRHVRLARGVAHFEVAKDASRPFVVIAAGVEVRAVGTAFSVQIDEGRVEVIVTEGRVAVGHTHALPAATSAVVVEENSKAPDAHAFVDAGQQAVVDISSNQTSAPPPRIASLPEGELAQRLAWRVPRLEFSATPLAEAVALLNQHGRVRLTLADPALGTAGQWIDPRGSGRGLFALARHAVRHRWRTKRRRDPLASLIGRTAKTRRGGIAAAA
jgi:transmembrane sensor